MPSKPGHITLNFHPVLLERMKEYARENGLKMNAMLKEAFQLLEDHPELVKRKGRHDY
jgi:hypothetical protein